MFPTLPPSAFLSSGLATGQPQPGAPAVPAQPGSPWAQVAPGHGAPTMRDKLVNALMAQSVGLVQNGVRGMYGGVP